MSLPFFYIGEYDPSQTEVLLDEDTSKHIVGVLRMRKGSPLHLTDGRGNLLVGELTDDHKKHCRIDVKAVSFHAPSSANIAIGISLLKNASRFEWFLEKVTEVGVSQIIPTICARTEKQKFRADRMKNILVSAMLQSQQTWLPVLDEPEKFDEVVTKYAGTDLLKCIAYCSEDEKQSVADFQFAAGGLILIGPEGDFTKEEIDLAIYHGFIPVSLGNTRLRSETAGVVAAAILRSAVHNMPR